MKGQDEGRHVRKGHKYLEGDLTNGFFIKSLDVFTKSYAVKPHLSFNYENLLLKLQEAYYKIILLSKFSLEL